MQTNGAIIVMVTFEYLMATSASSVLLKDFFDYISIVMLGPELMQQFSLAIYSFAAGGSQASPWRNLNSILQFQTDPHGLFNFGPHSVALMTLGRNQTKGDFRMKRYNKALYADHCNDPAAILIAIFGNSFTNFVRIRSSASHYC